MQELKDVERVAVVNGSGTIYFNKVGGVWINHIKNETLDDSGMDKLLSVYQEFGCVVIKHDKLIEAETKAEDKKHVFTPDDFPLEMIVPDDAYRVVVKKGSMEIIYRSAYAIDPVGGMIFYKPTGGSITLKELRLNVFNWMTLDHGVSVHTFDSGDEKLTVLTRLK